MNSLLDTIKKFKHLILPVIILVLAGLTRFWKLSQLFHWTLDEEFWSYLPHQVAIFEHFPLIGGHIGGTGVYSGPMFVWFMGMVFFLINSNPILIAATVSFWGIVSTYLILKLGKKYFGQNQAYLAGFLYASSVLVVLYDRKYWNASLGLLLGNLVLLMAFSILKKPTSKKILLLGFISSLAFQAHMTGLVHIVFGFVFLLFYKLPKKYLGYYLVVILLTHLPLFGFELRHDWLNTKALFKYLNQTESVEASSSLSQSVIDVSKLITNTYARVIFTPAQDIAQELTLCQQMATTRSIPQISFGIFALLVLAYSLYLLFKQKNLVALLLWLNIFLVIIYRLFSPETFYLGQLSEYYLLPSFGAFILVLADLLVKLANKFAYPVYGLGVFLVIINLHIVFNLDHSHGLARKLNLFEIGLKNVGNQTYHLEVVGDECQIYGYRFLTNYFKKKPSSSYVDRILGHIYLDPTEQQEAEVKLIIDEDSGLVRINNLTN